MVVPVKAIAGASSLYILYEGITELFYEETLI